MKLPSVYANKINKNINNNTDYYHGERSPKKDLDTLKKHFDKNGYTNRLAVTITTKDGTTNEKLVLLKTDHFITINNKNIYFKDIIDYEIKDN